jgi:signal transduction histidine kinase
VPLRHNQENRIPAKKNTRMKKQKNNCDTPSPPTQQLNQNKELTQRIILAQEEERSRIAQEIHDVFGQALIALKIFIVTTRSDLADPDPALKEAYKRVEDELNSIIDKARDLSHELSPPSLKYIGLIAAINKTIRSLKYDQHLKITFTHKNVDDITFDSNNIIIYRIAQEALTNIIKHAHATEVTIKMVYAHDRLSLEIRDNGKGFVCKKRPQANGLGIDLMRERAELIKGTVSVVSRPQKGTTVKLIVPVVGDRSS